MALSPAPSFPQGGGVCVEGVEVLAGFLKEIRMDTTTCPKGRVACNVTTRESLPSESAFPCDCKGPVSQRSKGETVQAQRPTGAKALGQKCSMLELQDRVKNRRGKPAGLWPAVSGSPASTHVAMGSPSVCIAAALWGDSGQHWNQGWESHCGHPEMVARTTVKGCWVESSWETGGLGRRES